MRHGSGWLVVRDDLQPHRGRDVDLRGDGLWLSIIDERDGRFTLGLEAFALAVDDPSEERGERVPLGFDIEFEHGRVYGEVLIGDERLDLDEVATLDVS